MNSQKESKKDKKEKSKEKHKSKKDKKDKHKGKDATSNTTTTTATNGDDAPQLKGPQDAVERGLNDNDDDQIMEEDLNNGDGTRRKLTPLESHYAAVTLSLPTSSNSIPDPSMSSNLKPIRDDGSSFAQVARSCLHITQFVGTSSGHDDGYTVASTQLFHDKTHAKILSECFAALVVCSKEHKDRRCRILACQTLALTARSAYARIRHAPILFTLRDSVVQKLEDEVGSEIPTALLTVALEDGDDGVSATAVEALGMLTLATSNANSGTIIDDELLHEIQAIAFARASPYAPSLRSVMMSCRATIEEDPSVAQLELQGRIFRSIMAPRLLGLVTRIVHYNASHHHRMTLPFITTCLIHQIRTNAATTFEMDRSTYAKRWADVDVVGLVNDVVTALILPSMQSCLDGDLAHAAALCAIRLANACPNASWVLEICQWAIIVLKEENSATGMLESKMGTMGALLIALRVTPLPERAPILESMVNEIASLPYTTMVPHGVSSPGLLLRSPDQSKSSSAVGNAPYGPGANSADPFACYRKPARVAFFTELALSLFLDGPLGVTPEVDADSAPSASLVQRSFYLKRFLSSAPVVNICKESEKPAIVIMRDEILLVFTTVAREVGRRFRESPDGSAIAPPPTQPSDGNNNLDIEEWVRLAFTTLSIFSPCARWGKRPAYLEEDLCLLTAGQSSYIRLLQEFLHFVGLIHSNSCVTFKLTPNACPPHLLWDQMIESASSLTNWEMLAYGEHYQDAMIDRSFMGCCNDVLVQDVAALIDDFVEKDLGNGIVSHHMRLFTLTLGADQWTQGRYVAIRRHMELANGKQNPKGDVLPLSLNMASAKDLLIALSPKRLLTKLLEYHTVPVDAQGKKKKDPIKKLAVETVRVCVACVENIAITAANWRQRFGNNPESQSIVHMALASLEGRLDDSPMDDSLRPIMGPLCDAAMTRIKAFNQVKHSNGEPGLPASELVMQPLKYKIKPLVSSSMAKGLEQSAASGWEYLNGYLMQLSRQIISSRVDGALFSMPTADDYFSCYARARNWLRLVTPPLPQSRDARGKRFQWRDGGARISSVWGHNITSISAGSDAVSAVLAYTMARIPRYDNEEEYRIMLLMQVCNLTAVEITEGLRLELGVVYRKDDTLDKDQEPPVEGAGERQVRQETAVLVSASTAYRQSLAAGDNLVWEVALNHLGAGKLALHPTIVFRNISEEPDFATKVGGSDNNNKAERKSSMSSINSRGSHKNSTIDQNLGEDDFQVSTKEKGSAFGGDQVESENVCLSGDPVELSPFLGLQPCPLVFFRDSWGDLDTFRFLWFRMSNAISALRLSPKSSMKDAGFAFDDEENEEYGDIIGQDVATASSLSFEGEAIPGGYATKLWAFMALTGERVLCIMTEAENGAISLHLRADCKKLLLSLVGSHEGRQTVIDTLAPQMTLL